jgi:hypothetical protein
MSQPVLFIGGGDAAIEMSRINRETPSKSRKETPDIARTLAKADNALRCCQ